MTGVRFIDTLARPAAKLPAVLRLTKPSAYRTIL